MSADSKREKPSKSNPAISTLVRVDTPEDIRDKYQYFTEANVQKLKAVGYEESFTTLELGVKDYVQNYLLHKRYY